MNKQIQLTFLIILLKLLTSCLQDVPLQQINQTEEQMKKIHNKYQNISEP